MADNGDEIRRWLENIEQVIVEDEASRQANAIAEAVLMAAAQKVASLRAAAEQILVDAQNEADAIRRETERALAQANAEAGQILFAAHAEAEHVRQQATAMLAHAESVFHEARNEARLSASQITGSAHGHRDLLLTATLERIAELTATVMGMADKVVAHAEDPAVARAQLAQFMLVLTEAAEDVESENGQPPDLEELARRRNAGR